jgi:hypothetical protein
MDLDSIRHAIKDVYCCLRKAKALSSTTHGIMALVLDGHESHSTYNRRCTGCLERSVPTRFGHKTQFYHRSVTAMLLSRPFPILLDAEPIKPEEDEVDTALRLLERLLANYPRAFEIVLGDALYTDPRVYNFLVSHGKDVLTVLKRNTPELLTDAKGLFDTIPPSWVTESPDREVWDQSKFTSWQSFEQPIRIVRSQETTRVKRQIDQQTETILHEWYWATTVSQQRAVTAAAVDLGHARWDIENQGFNETVTRWHVDHVYKHHETAILSFTLLAMLAFNLFYAFYFRNLKESFRRSISCLHLARCLSADIYSQLYDQQPRAP